MKIFAYLRKLNERLMRAQGWISKREHAEMRAYFDKVDARTERLIELFEGQPVTTGRDADRLAALLRDQQQRQDEFARKQKS